MRKPSIGGTRTPNLFTSLVAFVLSALLGVGFVLLVDEVHRQLSGQALLSECLCSGSTADYGH